MNLWSELDALRARHDVLEHPFYVRWSAGELARPELARYAGQYRHAVVALATAAAQAAASIAPEDGQALKAELQEHAREEEEHVELWDEFCRAVGCDAAQPANAETLICARTWSGEPRRPLLRSLMALHAIEVGQPAISATKLRGLTQHYGVHEGPATSYFELHELRDIEHAAHSRALIERSLERSAACSASAPESDLEALLAEAEAVLRANWLLLDGVERGTQASLAA